MMGDGQGGDRPGLTPDQSTMSHAWGPAAADWITIWQSELSALAADREAQEAWSRWLTGWTEACQAALRAWPSGHDTRTDAPAGPAPAMAASDDRDDAIRRLGERVAALERRLANRDGGA